MRDDLWNYRTGSAWIINVMDHDQDVSGYEEVFVQKCKCA